MNKNSRWRKNDDNGLEIKNWNEIQDIPLNWPALGQVRDLIPCSDVHSVSMTPGDVPTPFTMLYKAGWSLGDSGTLPTRAGPRELGMIPNSRGTCIWSGKTPVFKSSSLLHDTLVYLVKASHFNRTARKNIAVSPCLPRQTSYTVGLSVK